MFILGPPVGNNRFSLRKKYINVNPTAEKRFRGTATKTMIRENNQSAGRNASVDVHLLFVVVVVAALQWDTLWKYNSVQQYYEITCFFRFVIL